MRKRGYKTIQQAEELNITAFLNLMVILVPFLLITAVFSRLTILELNLPALDAQSTNSEQIKLQLELVVRENSFDIQDANLGLINRIERSQEPIKWKPFSDVMLAIKTRFPDETSISLLLEPEVDYKTMITVMDKIRSTDIVVGFDVETVVLFPDISIGDAKPTEYTEVQPTSALKSVTGNEQGSEE